jgi:hypothetical protein
MSSLLRATARRHLLSGIALCIAAASFAPTVLRAQLAVDPAYPDTPHAERAVVDSIARLRVAALQARCASRNSVVELRCLAREYRMSGDTLRRLEARFAALMGATPRPVPTVIARMSSRRPADRHTIGSRDADLGATSGRSWRGPGLVAAGGAAALLDPDRGGYAERWSARSTWTGQDKQAHGGIGFGLGATFGARWTCATATAFELVQGARGYSSVPDAMVTCASAFAGSGVRRLLDR